MRMAAIDAPEVCKKWRTKFPNPYFDHRWVGEREKGNGSQLNPEIGYEAKSWGKPFTVNF